MLQFSFVAAYTCSNASPPVYPKTVVYTSFFVPIVSTSAKTTTWNFSNTILHLDLLPE